MTKSQLIERIAEKAPSVPRREVERIVNTVVPGQVLGLTSFLSDVPRTTAARTASDAVVFRLTRAAYDAVVGERSRSM